MSVTSTLTAALGGQIIKTCRLDKIERPRLVIVVDTEEEFDWGQQLSRANRSVTSFHSQELIQSYYREKGIVPHYLIDHPILHDEGAVALLRRWVEAGECVVGAHLHPWVNPPHDEDVTPGNSFQGNLPAHLEKAKIENLTDGIEDVFGFRPNIFKCGRYGIGPSTTSFLQHLGYQVDCSFVPYTNYEADEGPDFTGVPDQPFWFEQSGRLLEVPLGKGFIGSCRRFGPRVQGAFDQAWFSSLKVGGILSRSGALSRVTLSPEEAPASKQIELLTRMFQDGARIFSLTYHSPSLAIGQTPYVKTERDQQEFLAAIREVTTFFETELNGEFATLNSVYDLLTP